MPDFLANLFSGEHFMPHGYCLAWDPALIFLWILANAGIAIAYFSIPMALWTFVRKRKDLPYPWMFRLFALFITACGLTHCLKIWTLYHGTYWLETLVDLYTAAVSVATATLLWPLIPQALTLRSAQDLKEALEQKHKEAIAREEAERQLWASEEQLRLMIESVKDYGIFMLDTSGNVISWNEGARKITGYEPDEILGKHFSGFYRSADVSEGIPAMELESARETGRFEDLGWRLRKGGIPYFANVVISAVWDEQGSLRGFSKVVRDLSDWKKAQDDLKRRTEELAVTNAALQIARDAALEASSLKSAFVANISHELRTPLSAILGMNELLLTTALNDEQRNFANNVHAAGKSLLSMVNDLLDLSKIESGKMELELIPIQLHKLTEDSITLLLDAIHNKGIEFSYEFDEAIPHTVLGDPVRLCRVLVNLIGNALKFTNQGQIAVRVRSLSQNQDVALVEFIISDTGIGIAEDEMKYLFLPVTQVDRSNSRKFGGSGLGLSISKRLIELMHGEIGVNSAKGKGSEFWFRIPFKTVTPVPGGDVEVQLKEAIVSRQDKHDDCKILIVEDNPVLQDLVLKQLRNLEFAARAVASGEEAVEEISSNTYALVLMDCHLPNMDGFEATRIIREKESTNGKRIPIIAMTARAMKGDREKCFAVGMDDYLSKPYTIDQLKDIIKRWLPEQTL